MQDSVQTDISTAPPADVGTASSNANASSEGGSSAGVSTSAPSAATPAAIAPGSSAAFSDFSLDTAKLALRKVKDPDLNLNIVDLGLVIDVRVEGNDVNVDMTLTSPGCPSGPQIMGDAERMLKAIPGVGNVAVNLVWSPMWTPERIEPRVRAYMGL